MYLLLLLLLGASVSCLLWGLWIAVRDRSRGRVIDALPLPVPDEDQMIFDRVCLGLAQIPRLNNPRAAEAAQAEVMRTVGERYGLSATDVEAIYWRVWRLNRGKQP